MVIERVLNLKPDLPDVRDWPLAKLLGAPPVALPVSDYHLRVLEPPIRDQGSLGACTGFAYIRIHRFAHRIAGFADPDLSPLFEYYNEREAGGTVASDSGSSIRQSIKSAVDLGVCDELLWVYDISKFTVKPNAAAYADAFLDRTLEYYTTGNDITQIKQAIVNGFPVSIGVSVYNSFMGNNGGDIPMPLSNEQQIGGHNIVLDTYDDATQRFGFPNSWGIAWGKAGFGTIPYAYIQQLGFDGWVVKKTQGVVPPAPPDPLPVPSMFDLVVVDNKNLATVNASWLAVPNATAYTVQIGANPTTFGQSFNAGNVLKWSAAYPHDGLTRYMRVLAIGTGGVVVATSDVESFGPATPTPPAPVPTVKYVRTLNLTTDVNGHVIAANAGYSDGTSKSIGLL